MNPLDKHSKLLDHPWGTTIRDLYDKLDVQYNGEAFEGVVEMNPALPLFLADRGDLEAIERLVEHAAAMERIALEQRLQLEGLRGAAHSEGHSSDPDGCDLCQCMAEIWPPSEAAWPPSEAA